MTQIVVPATATTPGYALNEEHSPKVNVHNHIPHQHGMDAKDAVFTSAVDLSRQIGHAEAGLTAVVGHAESGITDKVGHAETTLVQLIGQRAYDTLIAVEKTAAATNLAIEKTHAASQLLAVQNAAAQAKQLADCCCELKELTKEENSKTRDLINAIQLKNCQDELAEFKLREAIANRRPMIPGI